MNVEMSLEITPQNIIQKKNTITEYIDKESYINDSNNTNNNNEEYKDFLFK